MTHWYSIRKFTDWIWAICDLSNHYLFRLIPKPGSQKPITKSLESNRSTRFQAMNIYDSISEKGHQSVNFFVPCCTCIFGTVQATEKQRNKNRWALYRCMADILQYITYCDIQLLDMHITGRICQISHVSSRNHLHNSFAGNNLILHIL